MAIRLRFSLWRWCCLVCAIAVLCVCFAILQQRHLAARTATLHAGDVEPASKTDPPPAKKDSAIPFSGPLPLGAQEGYRVITDTLRRDDSIYLSLKRHRISEAQILRLDQALRPAFDSRTDSRPSDQYSLTLDSSGVVQHFHYVSAQKPERPVLVESRAGHLVARRLELPLATRCEALQVRIEDNLANAISAAGESDALTDLLADDIFGAVIDFRRHPRRGDRLGMLFEKLYKNDRFVRYGRILLAFYDGQVVSHMGVYFETPEGNRGYYDAEGESLKRMFLLYALPYRGITSRFSYKRLHPILKRPIPHLGTDYAADTGTQVWATARGRVRYAGWKGGLGKTVFIEHANGYVTRYGHLSAIQVRKGQYVEQKQPIGRVGSTGRATGPHLHYEIIKNNHHLNPETVNRGSKGKPLGREHLAAFRAHRDSLLAILEASLHAGRPMAAMNPASPSVIVE